MASVRTPHGAGPAIRPPAPLIAALEGRYRLAGEAGRGGMSRVWIARDLRHERDVVVKAVDTALLEPAAARRFTSEIEIVASLNHPHVVPLLDSGSAGDWLYYVMPRFGDGSLAEHLRGGPLAIAEAVRLAGEIADALSFAHAHGVVHRDVKPQNVLLAGGHALLADFGLAHAERSGSALTPQGAILGTPLYMSPEQATALESVDARSDQYSLACVLYEMLAGRPPFEAGAPELLAWLRHAEPPAPVEVHRPECPTAVARALRRALAKVPADRFETVAEFARALEPSFTPAGAPQAPGPAALQGFPLTATAFVGREAELWRWGGWLESHRWLTITGPGGVGKTRLAIELAARVRHRFPDGAWFVDLAGLDAGARCEGAVLASLGVAAEGNDPLAIAATHLGTRRALLVLDNAEHVLDGCAALVSALLERCRALHVVVTSRIAPGWPGEKVCELEPFRLPSDDGALADDESVRFFVARALDARPGFDAAAHVEAIHGICRALDGLPLALELAAARVRMLSPEEIRERLSAHRRLLTAASATAPRHASLEAAIQWSESLLSPRQRDLLARLSVFRGGFELDAAAHVAGDDEIAVLDALTRLAEHSLLVVEPRDGAPTRYRLLETIRAYAGERLTASAADEARTRHLQHYLALGERARAEFWGPRQREWSERVARDFQNLSSALEHSFESPNDPALSLRLGIACSRQWFARGGFDVARRMLERGIEQSAGRDVGDTRAVALYTLAGIVLLQGDVAAAGRHYRECLEIADRTGDAGGHARSHMGLGAVAAAERRFDDAERHYSACVETYRALGDTAKLAVALQNFGELRRAEGRHGEAADLLRECLVHAHSNDNQGLVALARLHLASVMTDIDRLGDALEHLDHGLSALGRSGADRVALEGMEIGARLAHRLGDDRRARTLLASATRWRERLAIPAEAGWVPTLRELARTLGLASGPAPDSESLASHGGLAETMDHLRRWLADFERNEVSNTVDVPSRPTSTVDPGVPAPDGGCTDGRPTT